MREILEKLINEEIDIKTAENLIKSQTILEFDEIARFDSKRQDRTGFPEAVFAPSKDYDDLLLIIKSYFESEDPQNLIITKLSFERSAVTFAEPEYVSSTATGAILTSSTKPGLKSIPRFIPRVTKPTTPKIIITELIIAAGKKNLLKCITFFSII